MNLPDTLGDPSFLNALYQRLIRRGVIIDRSPLPTANYSPALELDRTIARDRVTVPSQRFEAWWAERTSKWELSFEGQATLKEDARRLFNEWFLDVNPETQENMTVHPADALRIITHLFDEGAQLHAMTSRLLVGTNMLLDRNPLRAADESPSDPHKSGPLPEVVSSTLPEVRSRPQAYDHTGTLLTTLSTMAAYG